MNNVMALASARARSILRNPHFWFAVLLVLFMSGLLHPAHAADASASSTGLPWESPIEKLRKSVSGPVAFGLALLGIIGTGAGLIWGGEISQFMKQMIYMVLVVCIIVFANTLLTGALFSGATVPSDILLNAGQLGGQMAHVLVAGNGTL